MPRLFRRLLLIATMVGVIWAVRSALLVRGDRKADWSPPTPQPPAPSPPTAKRPPTPPPPPPAPRPVPVGRTDRSWREPLDDGACPPSYPVKVKLRSQLYHLPGMAAYGRTRPDRCYRSGEDAVADGFTRAKR